MFRHYTRVAFRNIKRNLFYSLISIAGLALGLSACIILVNYASHEKSYDQFLKDNNHIYRVESYFTNNNQVTDSWVSSSFGYAAAMKSRMPEIDDITRVNNYDCERIVKYHDKVYREPRAVMADSNFFGFFSYPLIKGDPVHVLREPNSIAISETAARKYFPGEDPIGKIMRLSTLKKSYDCAVTGIFKDFPHNSNLQLDLLISYNTSSKWERDYWYMHEAYTYVKVNSPAAVHAIENKFPALAEDFKTEPALKLHKWCVNLVPLTSIHLNAIKGYEMEEKGSRTAVNMLLIIAFVILVISWVNYINLFISKAMERAGEIGVRKMAGAGSGHILKQFLTESLVVNFISLVVFFVLTGVLSLLAPSMGLEDVFYGIRTNVFTWEIIAIAFVSGTIITGFIPALVLKKLKMATVLKNKLSFSSGAGNALRKVFITFQYFSAVVLIISTLTIRKQLSFMQSQDLGIATGQTVVFKTPAKTDTLYNERMKVFTEKLKQTSGVKEVALSSAIPGKMVGYVMANRRAGDPEKINRMCDMFRVDYDFLPAYNLQLIKGRNFSKDYSTDKETAVILTENAMNLFGFHDAEEAVNSSINLEGHEDKRFAVIGVVKDYHQLSLKESFRPVVFIMYNPWNWINNHFISVKTNRTASVAFVNTLQKEFNGFFPESSFDYFFLDDYFNKQYRQDIRYGQFVLVFSLLALFIVVLGIVSMSGFMLLKRKKEIGIRKVNGAGTLSILRLLNMHFVKLLALAFLVGIPVSVLAMYSWLQNFAYRTSMDVFIPVVAIGVILLVTVITVTIISYKAAMQNPVKVLRNAHIEESIRHQWCCRSRFVCSQPAKSKYFNSWRSYLSVETDSTCDKK